MNYQSFLPINPTRKKAAPLLKVSTPDVNILLFRAPTLPATFHHPPPSSSSSSSSSSSYSDFSISFFGEKIFNCGKERASVIPCVLHRGPVLHNQSKYKRAPSYLRMTNLTTMDTLPGCTFKSTAYTWRRLICEKLRKKMYFLCD
ncbi:uncharacterized protein LOC144199577 [Stigmatopora nigra]